MLRLSVKLIKSYKNYPNFNNHTVFDRFGILDKVSQPFDLPCEIDSDLIELSLDRVMSLGKNTILWSGEIDSTFVC